MSETPVVLDVDAGVATLTLNRPDARNPLTTELSAALRDHLDDLTERDDVRCVVLRGAGPAFSAGGDIKAMRERLDGDGSLDDAVHRLERTTNETIASLVTCPYPTVALVDGPAVGAGANLAIACDVQLGSESASVGFVFRQVGLSVDAGTSYLLPRIVGENVAKELVYTGEILDADRALDLGLLNHVYPDDDFEDEAAAFVERVADGPTVAFRHAKRLIREGLDKSLQSAMTDEATAQGLVFETDDHREGVEAFLEQRDPDFDGR
ncbi:enoyl-CoA hydratase/isomerase family protein [Halocalculus aciditolerans]|uniref:Enoyl-CoA hydratase n=1 Tax=Halocalculus aciditolerans TaxID=1383812 RepID=A0A830F2A7_9EURY|nr:enoyl-CoA hydratase [Halocalculus aciditolerans]GGL48376.1 enoyl-CoA hydratase [Halocalculus aciditolerans]